MKPKSLQPTHFYLIRHGETEWNATERIQGHADSPLTSKGIAQAHETAVKLAVKPIQHIYSSDLGRALQTARIIANVHQQPVTAMTELREVTFGHYDGGTVAAFRVGLSQPMQERRELPYEEQMQYQLRPEIESFHQTAERMIAALQAIHHQHPGQHVAVVTHGAALRCILMRVLRLREDSIPPGSFNNAGFIYLTMTVNDVSIEAMEGVLLLQ